MHLRSRQLADYEILTIVGEFPGMDSSQEKGEGIVRSQNYYFIDRSGFTEMGQEHEDI